MFICSTCSYSLTLIIAILWHWLMLWTRSPLSATIPSSVAFTICWSLRSISTVTSMCRSLRQTSVVSVNEMQVVRSKSVYVSLCRLWLAIRESVQFIPTIKKSRNLKLWILRPRKTLKQTGVPKRDGIQLSLLTMMLMMMPWYLMVVILALCIL